ncbi:acetyl-CoA carboxylase biotin carboxyl carrier protein subunit [Pseudomonas cichorii]|nr:acetyl-CoA carboxylase biotin carboxyl carrier protein subunit [Pseudomonas cichorii]MBX8538801.1 acetyl-CoA carboxylase biotin carboxyl carrier protein subunit [Pseudomonas cichorii]MBX8544063.1 acetyl-CoA carboxylase biotin carboxyl carrier protein subunit [Pseudomonas cichorii]MBX8563780.1 acetyl-CoA carboxylase biotin carboxyl carrier protein subunit [Pseudomonas cichorii]MBX8578906.1 acetyl-CoA carboxylase biotin carboxyl carrier protein subunit [Pseudomonas cichorii]MBX8589317.1 acety
MDQERIKALIGLLAESDLIELSLTEGDSTLRLFKEAAGNVVEAPLAPARVATGKAASVSAPVKEEVKLEVKASLYGVLHLTPAVGEAPFVQIGDSVEAGQTLAVIEAMKMFHPLKANRAGIVEAILVDGGTEVEAGQPLFRIG